MSAAATQEEIKQSYYLLAKKYHPDALKEEEKEASKVIIMPLIICRIISRISLKPTPSSETLRRGVDMISSSSETPQEENFKTKKPMPTGKTESKEGLK